MMVSDIEDLKAPSSASREELEQEITQLMNVRAERIKLLKERADYAAAREASAQKKGSIRRPRRNLGCPK